MTRPFFLVGGPQVGELPRLGGVTNLSIQFLNFFEHLELLSHERWGTSVGNVSIVSSLCMIEAGCNKVSRAR